MHQEILFPREKAALYPLLAGTADCGLGRGFAAAFDAGERIRAAV